MKIRSPTAAISRTTRSMYVGPCTYEAQNTYLNAREIHTVMIVYERELIQNTVCRLFEASHPAPPC